MSRMLEHQHQVAVIDWWAWMHKGYGLPEFALFAVPNGGDRHPAVAGKLKAEGTRAGIPDLVFPVARGAFHGLVIEMKSAAGKHSPAQKEVLAWFVVQDWRVHTCYSAESAIKALKAYLDLAPQ